MADYRVRFQGGPCDGTTQTVSDVLVQVGEMTCRGTVYTLTATGATTATAVPTATTSAGGGTVAQFAPDLFGGYQDLKRSIVKRLRPAITRAQRNNQLALKALPRIHRVRGR